VWGHRPTNEARTNHVLPASPHVVPAVSPPSEARGCRKNDWRFVRVDRTNQGGDRRVMPGDVELTRACPARTLRLLVTKILVLWSIHTQRRSGETPRHIAVVADARHRRRPPTQNREKVCARQERMANGQHVPARWASSEVMIGDGGRGNPHGNTPAFRLVFKPIGNLVRCSNGRLNLSGAELIRLNVGKIDDIASFQAEVSNRACQTAGGGCSTISRRKLRQNGFGDQSTLGESGPKSSKGNDPAVTAYMRQLPVHRASCAWPPPCLSSQVER